jgi:hypothetical protein
MQNLEAIRNLLPELNLNWKNAKRLIPILMLMGGQLAVKAEGVGQCVFPKDRYANVRGGTTTKALLKGQITPGNPGVLVNNNIPGEDGHIWYEISYDSSPEPDYTRSDVAYIADCNYAATGAATQPAAAPATPEIARPATPAIETRGSSMNINVPVLSLMESYDGNRMKPVSHENGGPMATIVTMANGNGENATVLAGGTMFGGGLSGPGAFIHGLRQGMQITFNGRTCDILAPLPAISSDPNTLGALADAIWNSNANMAFVTSRDAEGYNKIGYLARCS